MKNLLLLRHASANNRGADGTDFTRSLTEQGVQEAAIQGRFLREAGILPGFIAASNADRARQTAETVMEAMGNEPVLDLQGALYNAPGNQILEQIQELPDEHDSVMVVAHMPGVAEVLDLLTVDFAEVTVTVSPATLAGVSFNRVEAWSHVVPGSGVLEWLLPPLLLRE